MNYPTGSRGGFTLVEIMIVVTIIGLLAALAVPVWLKTRQSTICSTMDNDARQLASAAQQYFMEYGASTVPVSYAAGVVSGPLSDRVRLIGVQYTPFSINLTTTGNFSLEHSFLSSPRTYNADGRVVP